MATEKDLKDYMESAGENDALRLFEDKLYEISEEIDLEPALREISEDLEHDWSYFGFDFLGEMDNLKEEIKDDLSEEEIHEIVGNAFYIYYVSAFLDKFKSLVMEALEEAATPKVEPPKEDPKTSIMVHESTRHALREWENRHYIGRSQTYEEIILSLMQKQKQEPNFLQWHMDSIDKIILQSIQEGRGSSAQIHRVLREQGHDPTLRTIQIRLEKLMSEGLILRQSKVGKNYSYVLNGKVI